MSWIGLFITAFAIIIAAVCMSVITRVAPAATWFHGMRYHAMQFVSTSAILLALLLCAYASARRSAMRSRGRDYRSDGGPLFFFLLSFLLHLALLCLLVLVQFHRFFDPKSLSHYCQLAFNFIASPYWVWPALLAFSKMLSNIIVEFPGDVAIYVTPNKLDRFDKVRKKIKQTALDSLMPLYSACAVHPGTRKSDPSVPLYNKIAVVGHSLGSVIAYDTLNRLLVLDGLLGNQFAVAERT